MIRIALHNRGVRIFDFNSKRTVDLDYIEGTGFLMKFNEYAHLNGQDDTDNMFFEVERGISDGDDHQIYSILSRLHKKIVEYYNAHQNNENINRLGMYDEETNTITILSDAGEESIANKLLIKSDDDKIRIELECNNQQSGINNTVMISEKRSRYGNNFSIDFASTQHMFLKIAKPFDDVMYNYYGYGVISRKR